MRPGFDWRRFDAQVLAAGHARRVADECEGEPLRRARHQARGRVIVHAGASPLLASSLPQPRPMPHFRFHGELNDLLRPELRDRSFDRPCARRASAKHAIEAIGVPHTEVGRLLLDGHPATLGHLLRETDSLEVFPATPPVLAAGAPPPRFLADAHLGGLARRLRAVVDEVAGAAPARPPCGPGRQVR
ncbi:hypothetical protein FBR03_05105 [Betaproteobacteria bacterium PRO1]|nr:hypothetical protein [Betaproteobacteria bacterium PRO1]